MDPAEIPWGDHGVDVVIESTGIFTAREKAAGAPRRQRRSAWSSPRRAATPTPRSAWASTTRSTTPAKHTVISNASCTTNCLAPLAKVLNDRFGIEQGLMTTVHAYTSDQSLQDLAKATRSGKPDLRTHARRGPVDHPEQPPARRRRSASCCPSSRASSTARRSACPTPTGSITDLTANLGARRHGRRASTPRSRKPPTTSRTAACSSTREEPLVSADIVGNPASCIFSAEDTMANGTHGEGARLVRQRVGLLEPPRRPRRVRRRVAPDPEHAMPWTCRAWKTCRSTRGDARAGARRLQRADARRRHRRRPAHHDRAARRSSGCATRHAVVVVVRAPRAARRARPTRSTRWRRSPRASASCSAPRSRSRRRSSGPASSRSSRRWRRARS